ncbi:MAG: VOC family protein [Epsilonproteobacteria bacterium]|nr:VOC family protein [Campylobacterota bacterium]
MKKAGELVVVVECVEQALRFYTDKLAFDVVDIDIKQSEYEKAHVVSARLKKGKCFVTFKSPSVEELAEFSFIKRCAGRCISITIEIRTGLGKYFDRCCKRDIKVIRELEHDDEMSSFTIKDPFGLKVTFFQPREVSKQQSVVFLGGVYSRDDLRLSTEQENRLHEQIVDRIKPFGLLRRTARKFVKKKFKQMREALR